MSAVQPNPRAALKAMIFDWAFVLAGPQTGDDGLPIGLAFIVAAILLPTGMSEDSDATCTFDVKCREADAVVRRSARRNGRSDLHDGKNVIVLGKCGGVLTSDVRHILEPFTGLRIDDAK
jgi:hypothetical protein